MYLKLKDANAQIKKEFNFSLKHFFRNFDFFYLDLPGNYFDFFFLPWPNYFDVFYLDPIFRLAVQCVWTAWRTWSSSAATAHVRCVATGWRSAPYVERRWKSGSFCISDIEKVVRSAKVIVEKWWKSKFLHTLGGRQNKSWMALFMWLTLFHGN